MYLKLTKERIKHIINFAKNNLIDTKSCNGIIVLSRQNYIKQIIIDYQSFSATDYVITHKKDHRLDFLKLVKNKDPNHYMVLTFDYSIRNDNCIPNIYEFIKVCLFSIYRKVFNHLFINCYDKLFVISLKRNFLFELIKIKKQNKLKISEFIIKLFHILTEDYHNNNNDLNSIPNNFYQKFNITQCNNDINILYSNYNIL